MGGKKKKRKKKKHYDAWYSISVEAPKLHQARTCKLKGTVNCTKDRFAFFKKGRDAVLQSLATNPVVADKE